jgi:NADH-quinone oxidoreductase subunit G/NADP-reducing hydrogenase subunit HndD
VKRGKTNEYLDNQYVEEEVIPMTERAADGKGVRQKKNNDVKSVKRNTGDMDSVRVMALEAEVNRLKQELADSQETVEILKEVMSDYAKKPKKE